MQTYDVVGGQVTRVSPNGGITALTVTNADTTLSVYVSDTPTVGGYPLGPGSSMSWDPLRPLYLSCDTGSLVKVYILENAGNLFNADAVAQSIINAGLATDIAQEISIAGAPPINVSHPVIDVTAVMIGGTAWSNGVFYPVDKFNSLTFSVRDYGANGQVRSVNVSFFDDLGREITRLSFATRDNKYSAARCPVATFTIPCLGTSVKFSVSAAPLGSNVSVIAVGSYAAVPRPRYFMDYPDPDPLPANCARVGLAIDGAIGINYNPAGVGTFRWAFPMTAGACKLVVDGFGGGGAGSFFAVLDIAGQANVSLPTTLAINTYAAYELNLPARPCELYVTTYAGIGQFRTMLYSELL